MNIRDLVKCHRNPNAMSKQDFNLNGISAVSGFWIFLASVAISVAISHYFGYSYIKSIWYCTAMILFAIYSSLNMIYNVRVVVFLLIYISYHVAVEIYLHRLTEFFPSPLFVVAAMLDYLIFVFGAAISFDNFSKFRNNHD